MHEVSLVIGLARQLEEICEQHGAQRVTRFELEVGALSNVVPSLLAEAIEVVESCPERGVIEVRRTFRASRLVQRYVLAAGERRVEVETRVELLLPHTAGALHAEIRAKATVLSEFYTEDGCLMEIQASPAVLGRLMAGGALPVRRDDGD